MRRFLPISFLLALASCARYADFSLPQIRQDHANTGFSFEELPNPVIARGAAGEWDSRDVLNPSVLLRDGVYYNFYSGYDGHTWHTGLATSSDGIGWQKQGKVLSPDAQTWEGSYIAANGSALRNGEEFSYWYQAGPKERPRIGFANSRNGKQWTKWKAPVLETGPRGSWDERGVADPYVISLNGTSYMYYLGQDRARRQRLGLARSNDRIHWEKLRANPILELGEPGSFDENGLGEPAVWASHGRYWMLYTGRDRQENRRIGLAYSQDGVEWKRARVTPIGHSDWDGKVVCDPAVTVQPDAIRVWFGGGDVASPDENLHGQIGLAILRPAGGTLAE